MKKANFMRMRNLDILLELYGMLDCSFARYLWYARPWHPRPYALLVAISRKLAEEHQHYAGKIAHVLASRRQTASSPAFPSEFTYYNDVSLEHLAPELLRHQRFLIGVTTAASGALLEDFEASRILGMLLISLRKYADVLEELLTRGSKNSYLVVPAQEIEFSRGFSPPMERYGFAPTEPQTAA